MAIPDKVVELVERFARNRDAYRTTPGGGGGAGYNETQVRREFINPLFEALGWDADNRQGYAEAYKDVIHEDVVRVGGATKAPDYCFRIGGQRKFIVKRQEVFPLPRGRCSTCGLRHYRLQDFQSALALWPRAVISNRE